MNWAYRKFHHIFGSFTYLGKPVHGFKSTPTGNPLDTFGRNLYLDTFNSAYGAGWKRENSFLMHKGTGKFCYGFYKHGSRPEGHGERYRATIIGPGVTPDIYWEEDALELVRPRVRPGAARLPEGVLRRRRALQGRLAGPARPTVPMIAGWPPATSFATCCAGIPPASASSRSTWRASASGSPSPRSTPLSLEPPLVGISIAQGAALHELLRAAGGFAVSLLAADQVALAQHFARGVPPIVAVERDRSPRGTAWAAARRRSRLARVRPRRRAPGRRPHLLRRQRRACRGGRAGRRSCGSAASTGPVIDAVVFDLDGVLVDTERCGTTCAEALVRERGGRWTERAQADMMGMSSTRVVALHARRARPGRVAGADQRRGREPHARALPGRPAADRRRGRRRSNGCAGVVPARARVVVEPAADRRRAGDRRAWHATSRPRCRRRRSRAASRRRTSSSRPHGGSASSPSAARPSRTRPTACERRTRRECAWSPFPNAHYPPASGRARARRRRARLARRADGGNRAGALTFRGKGHAGGGSEGRRDQTSRSSRMPSLTYTERSTPSRT